MDNYPFVTIRHHQCTIVQEQGVKCSACSSYHKSLQLFSKYHAKPSAKDISEKTNHRFLSKPTLINEVFILRAAFTRKIEKLVGYCDIDNINNHLILLEKEYMENDAEHRKATLAKIMMMFMVRGLFTDLEFPYASFPTGNLKEEQLVPIFYCL